MPDEFFVYSFEEFLQHLEQVRSIRNGRHSFEQNAVMVYELMKRQYNNPKESDWKAVRLILILQYLAQHITEFDNDDFAVNGSRDVGSLVGRHLLQAVHESFTSSSLASLGHGPAPASILERAAQFRSVTQKDTKD